MHQIIRWFWQQKIILLRSMPVKKGMAKLFHYLKQLYGSTVKILQRIQHFWQQYMITCQLQKYLWEEEFGLCNQFK